MSIIRWLYSKYVSFMYPAHKELSDQVLHFSYCFLLAMSQIVGRPYWWAAIPGLLIPYGVAGLREYYQHKHVVLYNKDLAFSWAGAICGVVTSFFIF